MSGSVLWNIRLNADDHIELKTRAERLVTMLDQLFVADMTEDDSETTQVAMCRTVLTDLDALKDEILEWRAQCTKQIEDAAMQEAQRRNDIAQGKCPVCRGAGKTEHRPLGSLGPPIKKACLGCKGTGKLNGKEGES